MHGYTDEEVERSLRWKMAVNGFPAGPVYLVSGATNNLTLPSDLRVLMESEDMGRVIVAIRGDEGSWTLIGTHGSASSNRLGDFKILNDDIDSFTPLFSAPSSKEELQILEVRDKDGNLSYLWAPPGASFGLLAGLILTLKRLQK